MIELPSGRVARLGPVDMSSLLLEGDIPDLLTPLVTQVLFEGVDDEEMEEQFALDKMLEQGKETLALINTVCKAAFIEPHIVDVDPGEGEITLQDVSIDDRSFVFSLAIYGVNALRSFRDQQKETLESLRNSENDE